MTRADAPSCCGSRVGAPALQGAPAAAARAALGIADPTPPARIAFDAGRSHVGTDAPVIGPDGEGPRRSVELSPFAIDAVPVTNARFAAFVAETGFVTVAERYRWAPVFRDLIPARRRPAPSNSSTPWWVACEGAAWFAPEGPGSDLAGRADHPAVNVAWEDARAFAAWAGGRLPSEAEWEHAARGGAPDPRFPWGDREPDDTAFLPANIWQGRFPDLNTLADGWAGPSPVGRYPPNPAGLFDMAGNVWEWTADPFRVRSRNAVAQARNAQSRNRREKVMKGGSSLCHASYCYRYRIAARFGTPAESGASNTGVRVLYAKSSGQA